jgi:hypothetical protein
MSASTSVLSELPYARSDPISPPLAACFSPGAPSSGGDDFRVGRHSMMVAIWLIARCAEYLQMLILLPASKLSNALAVSAAAGRRRFGDRVGLIDPYTRRLGPGFDAPAVAAEPSH